MYGIIEFKNDFIYFTEEYYALEMNCIKIYNHNRKILFKLKILKIIEFSTFS